MRDIHINSNLNTVTKFTSSSRSTEFTDILPLIISNYQKDCPKQHKDSQAMQWNKVSHCNLMEIKIEKKGNWENMMRISQWTQSHCGTNARIRRKTKQNNRTERIKVWDPGRKVKHVSKVNRVHKIYQFNHKVSQSASPSDVN